MIAAAWSRLKLSIFAARSLTVSVYFCSAGNLGEGEQGRLARALVPELDELVAVDAVVDRPADLGVVERLLHVVEAEADRPPVAIAVGWVGAGPGGDLRILFGHRRDVGRAEVDRH